MEKEIIKLIKHKGPLTGSEMWETFGGDGITLWQICKGSKNLAIRTVGTRYLRLDRRVDGFARLSPSIWREFLTYSVVGISGDSNPLESMAMELTSHFEAVSRAKLELAYHLVSGLTGQIESLFLLDHRLCFIIAGDIVYNMAHDVPRPERSTGKLVKGSDIDLVVIADDQTPDDLMKRLDDAIYQEKYRLLISPHVKEEVDYIVKKVVRVGEQIRFETFKHMVACKILHEGTLLYGSEDLFRDVKAMLLQTGVADKLNELEKRARIFRRDAEEYLLREAPEKIRDETLHLFYPSEESEEFE
jgi:hypothetical protein